MQNPKEEIPTFYKGLRSRYINLSEAIELHKYLSEELSVGEIKTVNNFIDFYSVIHISLNTYIIVSLANFFYHKEKSSGEIDTKRSLNHYLTLVNGNLKPLIKEFATNKKINELTSELKSQILKIESKEKVIERLLKNRNNFYAHNSEKYFNDIEKLHKVAPLFWQDITELETVCKEILDWHGDIFGFSTIEDFVKHKTKEDAENILYCLTFYKKASDAIVSGEISSELSDNLMDETCEEINRREIEIINENADLINKQVKETLEFQAEW